ncbi:hypothetical protein [Streptomyces sp. 147326]|uniref:hypothetical protein n=1 Tax=Streptomyces sp. 147326 TaxID=3074379 RepID=UPI00385717B2
MKKLYTALLAGTAMAFIGLQGVATAAPTGWPDGCSNFRAPVGGGWVATCSNSNGGHFKATVICQAWDGGGLINVDAVGWSSGNPSFVSCPPHTSVKSGGILTRSY